MYSVASGGLLRAWDLSGTRGSPGSPASDVVIGAGIDRDDTGWLQVWDATTGALLQRQEASPVKYLAFKGDGSALVAVTADNRVATLDPDTLEVVGTPTDLPELDAEDWDWPILAPDDRTLVVRRWVSAVTTVVDLGTGAARDIAFDGHPFTIAFSPDGRGLAVFYPGGTWGVVDLPALREGRLEYLVPVRTFSSNYVWEMTYSADGALLITSGNGVVDLWDAQTLHRLGRLGAGGKDDVATARPMSDGHTLVLAHPQGQVLTWDTRPQHLLDVACRLAGRSLTTAEWEQYLEHRAYQATCPASDSPGDGERP